jgi:glycosyltransferase involved in cell wall biosynthesis
VRILMLTQFYPPLLGGEERHVGDLSVALAARGHDVSVVTIGGDEAPEFEVVQGVRIHRIKGLTQRLPWLFKNPHKRQAPPFPDPQLTAAIRAIVARERPEIVHAHNWLVHSFLPLKAWSGARLVLTLHDYSFICAKKKLLYKDVPCSGPGIRKCLGCAAEHYGPLKGAVTAVGNWLSGLVEQRVVDSFLTVSEATARHNELPAHGLPYQVIPNFIPEDLEAHAQRDHPLLSQLPEEEFLLYVGALGHHKGVGVLLQAYERLEKAPPLVLIGYETTEYPVDTSKLPPGVSVLKNWPREAVMAAWERCMIGIAPSTCLETFGIVLIEAMTMARPVIASAIGGMTDVVVDGETGLFVPPGDALALAGAMAYLVREPALRAQMGQAGQRHARQFRASVVVPRIEQVYRQLLLQKRKGLAPGRATRLDIWEPEVADRGRDDR